MLDKVRNFIYFFGPTLVVVSLNCLCYKYVTSKDGNKAESPKTTTNNVTEIYKKISFPDEAHKVRENIEYEAECKMWEDIVRKYCR